MNYAFLLVGMYLLFCFPLSAKEWEEGIGTVKGVVTTSDNHPAAAVTVHISALKKSVVTDEKGGYEFRNISSGKYNISVSSIGYIKIAKEVTVEAGETVIVEFQLSESAALLAEILISSNRRSYISAKPSPSLRLNANLIEVPQNITVATSQTLADMGLLTKSEIFRISSSITKSYGTELDLTFQVRGFNATHGSYRNGVGGPVWWSAQEDASMIERMEFVKGPAGFMLANAEPGGLINVVTKQPTHQRILEVGVGVGSWNLKRTYVDMGGEIAKSGHFTYRLNMGVEKKNDYYQFGDFYRYWICPVVSYEIDKKTKLTYEFNYVKTATQENQHESITINGDYEKVPVDLAINDPNNPKFLGADVYHKFSVKHTLSDNWAFNTQAALMTTDWDGITLNLLGINATKDTLERFGAFSDFDGKLINLQLWLDGTFNTGLHAKHKLLVGIDYGQGNQEYTGDEVWENNPYPLSISHPVYYLPEDTLTAFHNKSRWWIDNNRWEAIYLQDHLKLFNKVIVTLAGRFTHLTTGRDQVDPSDPHYEITDNKFTPRLGLTWLITSDVSTYILHDESFLAQRGALYAGGSLPPLTGSNNEIGVKALLFKKQLAITASVYDTRKNDVGVSDPSHPGFYLRTGQIRSRGVELDLSGRINPHLFINTNFAYTNARISKHEDKTLVGIQNPGTCKTLANAWLTYQINNGALKGLGFGGGYQYTGKRCAVYPGWSSFEGNKYLPAYQLFDASVSYTTGRFSIRFNMYNICNVRYAAAGYWHPDYDEYIFSQGIPTNFRLQTTIKL